jgi:8-oxo-dGTP pyrophosphatase MutT (NUDIX family)
MKQFTVVFPIHKDIHEKVSILLGQQPEGKPLAGYVNGYGGKVEQNENIEDAAKRELLEELGVASDNLIRVGSVVVSEKEIIFFLTEIEYREYKDSEEMIHNTWYNLADNSFVSKMLPGDNILIKHIRNTAPKFFNHETLEQFVINKKGVEITEATKLLDNKTGFIK